MNLPVSLFIGLRYMRGQTGDRFSRFVSRLSAIGISLGVMAMVTMLSVMNGFERELKTNLLGFMPQAVLTSVKGSINPEQFPASLFKFPGITRIASVSLGDVVLQSYATIATGVMIGVQPDEYDPLTPYLENVKQSELVAGK
jgi:lipoprotein-releasing system permease protein